MSKPMDATTAVLQLENRVMHFLREMDDKLNQILRNEVKHRLQVPRGGTDLDVYLQQSLTREGKLANAESCMLRTWPAGAKQGFTPWIRPSQTRVLQGAERQQALACREEHAAAPPEQEPPVEECAAQCQVPCIRGANQPEGGPVRDGQHIHRGLTMSTVEHRAYCRGEGPPTEDFKRSWLDSLDDDFHAIAQAGHVARHLGDVVGETLSHTSHFAHDVAMTKLAEETISGAVEKHLKDSDVGVSAQTEEHQIGDFVILRGFHQMSKLNDSCGKVVGFCSDGRVGVQLNLDSKVRDVLPSNVRKIPVLQSSRGMLRRP